MQPIRGEVHAVTEFGMEVEDMILRDAVEWYKKAFAVLRALPAPTSMEVKYINQRWVHLVDTIAKREKVPTGSLSYYLGELAQAEGRVVELLDEVIDPE